METVKIHIGDSVHEIETKPITLVFRSPDLTEQTSYEGCLKLEPDHCLYHMERTLSFDPRTPELVAIVFKVDPDKVTPRWVKTQDRAVQHVAGRIDMTLKLMDKGIRVVWACPEAYLHPRHQCELGDVVIRLAKGVK